MYYVSVLVPARYATVPTCEVSAHTLLFARLQGETQPLRLCMQTAAVLKPDPERQTDASFRHLVPDHQTVSVLTFFLKTRA